MEKAQIWSVVGVALVVAVLASVVTATITGNAIRLNQDKYGRYQVYTTDEVYNKKEIDDMYSALKQNKVDKEEFERRIKNLATCQGVLNMLRTYSG
ncbi:MAG: hypothetical protein QXG18_01965 [Candidatus Pacearchaeota archaeon]